MSELNFYNGTHSGQEIDASIDELQHLSRNIIQTGADGFAVVNNSGSLDLRPIADGYNLGLMSQHPLATFNDVYSYYTENRNRARSACLGVMFENVSSLPVTHNQLAVTGMTQITADFYCVSMQLSNPSAQADDWTVTTGARSVTVDGSISGTTDIILFLADPYWA